MSSSVSLSCWLIMYCAAVLITQQMFLCTALDYGMPRSQRRTFAFKNFGLQTARGFGKRGGDSLYQLNSPNDVQLDADPQDESLDSLVAPPNNDNQSPISLYSNTGSLPPWMYSSWGPTSEAIGRRFYPFQFFTPMARNEKASNILSRSPMSKQDKA
ncbi:hypothetical protein RvY_16679 [Ramazzottius varieornatus]|uniref:Uncharacterized protein n=1 Tax=Ramazzottius varieornatus TaxID=947166 RepID=A0A1D1W029_RAMVA|nr:hypothetical protein RvY_16679 [Ramazzottius varieornatus]